MGSYSIPPLYCHLLLHLSFLQYAPIHFSVLLFSHSSPPLNSCPAQLYLHDLETLKEPKEEAGPLDLLGLFEMS
jgi:hypothetical protein